jgi:hypothetical protein
MSPSGSTLLVSFAYALSLPLFSVITARTLCTVKWHCDRFLYQYHFATAPYSSWSQHRLNQLHKRMPENFETKQCSFRYRRASGIVMLPHCFCRSLKSRTYIWETQLALFLCSRQCNGYLWAVEGTQSFRAVLQCRYG